MEKRANVEVHKTAPEGFMPQVQVAACYIEIDQKILLLQCSQEKLESGKWGVPAGKLEEGESPEQTAERELFEETGISLSASSQLVRLGALYIRKPEVDYVYHLFKVQLNQMPAVALSNEHQRYHWASHSELKEMSLMEGAEEALECYWSSAVKKRPGATLNAYIILKRDNKVLLSLRKNSGYCDGMWGLVAGHVEAGESATEAMVREVREEIGIELAPSQIQVVHVMHRQTNRLNVDIFFDCPTWEGVAQNLEPEKCGGLDFFPLDALPSNTIDYNVEVLREIGSGVFYSEKGWTR